MQLVNSRQEMLQPGQIIEIDVHSDKQQMPVQMAKAAFAKVVADPNSKVLRYGNTLFICLFSPSRQDACRFAIANADTLENVPISISRFFDDMQKNGVTKLVGAVSSAEVAAAFQQLSQKYDIRQGQNEKGDATFMVVLGGQQPAGLSLGE